MTLFCIDFDETITAGHTFTALKNERKLNPDIKAADVLAKFKPSGWPSHAWANELKRLLVDENQKVAITTFHTEKEAIEDYIKNMLVEAGISQGDINTIMGKLLVVANLPSKEDQVAFGKANHIKEAMEKLNVAEGEDVVLIDDNSNNIKLAKETYPFSQEVEPADVHGNAGVKNVAALREAQLQIEWFNKNIKDNPKFEVMNGELHFKEIDKTIPDFYDNLKYLRHLSQEEIAYFSAEVLKPDMSNEEAIQDQLSGDEGEMLIYPRQVKDYRGVVLQAIKVENEEMNVRDFRVDEKGLYILGEDGKTKFPSPSVTEAFNPDFGNELDESKEMPTEVKDDALVQEEPSFFSGNEYRDVAEKDVLEQINNILEQQENEVTQNTNVKTQSQPDNMELVNQIADEVKREVEALREALALKEQQRTANPGLFKSNGSNNNVTNPLRDTVEKAYVEIKKNESSPSMPKVKKVVDELVQSLKSTKEKLKGSQFAGWVGKKVEASLHQFEEISHKMKAGYQQLKSRVKF